MQQQSGLKARFQKMGPAAIITSAFIGPGTVITATKVGTEFSYALLWVLLLAVIALVVLMEMSSRVGIAGGKNVIDAAIDMFPSSIIWKRFVQTIIVAGTLAICFAFEAGNIVGASAGLADITSMPIWAAAVITAAIAAATVFMTSYTALSRIMQFFVSAMAILFVVTMVAVLPSIPGILGGMVIPSMPEGSVISALALVGTTLIGINLVLHSITSGEKWGQDKDVKTAVKDARFDILFNIIIGGMITMSIIVVAAKVLHGTGTQVNSPLVFTKSLEPVLGSWARIVGDLGLFAAGLSSAIAVPFSMRAILSKVFHTEGGIANPYLRGLGLVVVAFGTFLAISGAKPIQIIIFAQATSGFILPFIAALLIIAANNSKVMKEYVNKPWQNVVGGLAVLLSFILGFWGLYNVISKLIGG
ncbi:Nramp family divalent metal transporter [Dermabacteraceae bacterium TAE3-ERU5]|nr:Nramp family divalent metal transporter [Dermabacteraceae bacterium TAE3-ERU5]